MSTVKVSADNTPKLLSIEELKEKKQTSDKVFQGVKAAKGWRLGKAVTEEEYKEALKEFLESPIGGKKVEKNAERR